MASATALSIIGSTLRTSRRRHLSAYVNLGQLRRPDRFAAWLRRVTFGVAMNWLKAYRPKLFEQLGSPDDPDHFEIPDFAPGPPEVLEKRDLADAVLARN